MAGAGGPVEASTSKRPHTRVCKDEAHFSSFPSSSAWRGASVSHPDFLNQESKLLRILLSLSFLY